MSKILRIFGGFFFKYFYYLPWEKEKIVIPKLIEEFTIGKDKELYLLLAEYDVIGSIAHAKMLENIGLLTKDELKIL